jgi:hypothetical protein
MWNQAGHLRALNEMEKDTSNRKERLFFFEVLTTWGYGKRF